jgi:hypothetical protein
LLIVIKVIVHWEKKIEDWVLYQLAMPGRGRREDSVKTFFLPYFRVLFFIFSKRGGIEEKIF